MTLKELAEAAVRKAAGVAGNVINTVGSKFNSNQSTSNKSGSTDWSATLQNIGGNKVGSGFGLVKVAHAAENPPKVIKRNMSADGGHYDENGNFTPFFPGTTTLDTSKKQSVTEKQGDGDGGGNGDGGVNTDGGLMDEATRIYNAKKNAILSKLQMMKDEAQRLRGSAKGQFDFTTGEVKKNYDALKNLSKEKLTQALEGLTQEDVGVQNTYGRVNGNARRAMESAITKNRMLHRAMGSLGSSFYANAQGDTTNQGMNSINDNNTELAGKRAAIGTATSGAKTDFAQNDVAIGAEETQLNNQALKEYNDSIANADNLEKNYNIDSTEAIDEADAKLESSLDAIKKYLDDKVIANKASTAPTGTYGTFAKEYNAKSTIEPTLNNNQNIDSANKFIANASTGNPSGLGMGGSIADANTPSYLTYIKNKAKKKAEDTTGYFQNVA